MARVCLDPYGCGSSQTWHRDRREVTCGSVVVGSQVSNDVLLVTVVRVYGT